MPKLRFLSASTLLCRTKAKELRRERGNDREVLDDEHPPARAGPSTWTLISEAIRSEAVDLIRLRLPSAISNLVPLSGVYMVVASSLKCMESTFDLRVPEDPHVAVLSATAVHVGLTLFWGSGFPLKSLVEEVVSDNWHQAFPQDHRRQATMKLYSTLWGLCSTSPKFAGNVLGLARVMLTTIKP